MESDNTGNDANTRAPDLRDPRFYIEQLTSVPSGFSELLSSYSHIPEDKQIQHITSIRSTAYAQHPYPCLGRFRFLDLDLSVHPLYQSELLPRLKHDEHALFLDMGCCVGQDLRKLALDGVPHLRLYGADLVPEFVDIGFRLFRDEDRFERSRFLAPANVIDDDEPNPLKVLVGKITDLHVSAVFHLFERAQQMKLARRCLSLLKRDAGRCLILGGDAAKVDAGEVVRADGSVRFRHNGQSWRELWEEAIRGQGAKVEVGHQMRDDHPLLRRVGNGDAEEGRVKVIGSGMEGFRWGVWWVWVDFDGGP